MLRALALLLLLANLGLWAYTQGHLAVLGLAPFEAREPERLAQQVAPQTLRVLNAPAPVPEPAPAAAEPTPAAPAETAAPTETQAQPALVTAPAPAPAPAPAATGNACWQASRLSSGQAALLRAALVERADLQGRWSLTEARIAPRWLVYVGPLASERALQQRRAELTQAQIEHRALPAPLAPGLALGTFSSRERAQTALAEVRRQGVTDARVLQERPESITYTLLLNPLSSPERRQFEAKALLPPNALQPCP